MLSFINQIKSFIFKEEEPLQNTIKTIEELSYLFLISNLEEKRITEFVRIAPGIAVSNSYFESSEIDVPMSKGLYRTIRDDHRFYTLRANCHRETSADLVRVYINRNAYIKLRDKFNIKLPLQVERKNILRAFYASPEKFIYIVNQYELSLHTALETIKENKEYNDGKVDPIIEERAERIFLLFLLALEEKIQENKEIEKLHRKATVESHLERLDNEIDYIDKFIRGDN